MLYIHTISGNRIHSKNLKIFGIKHLLLVYRKCWIDWTELVCHEMPIIRRMTRKYFLPSCNILLELWKVAYDSWNAEMATKMYSYKELGFRYFKSNTCLYNTWKRLTYAYETYIKMNLFLKLFVRND